MHGSILPVMTTLVVVLCLVLKGTYHTCLNIVLLIPGMLHQSCHGYPDLCVVMLDAASSHFLCATLRNHQSQNNCGDSLTGRHADLHVKHSNCNKNNILELNKYERIISQGFEVHLHLGVTYNLVSLV
ncbi:hypothetical protein GUJ93_ZPchr0012g22124 [Zizania palustris]|uniref:Uncharacterized protein n=1 Tax=Zizania palustris TaxID=103762 RepID=A0A8J6BTV7_ZIZPA|nr:hypothetical protein GUJ93_ZPchr0012g22124 [Zizania palustris]